MGHPADHHQHGGLYPCLALFVFFYQDIYGLATGVLPQTPPPTWYAWFWVAPCASWGIGLLVLLTALVVLYVLFLLLGTSIAAPFSISWPNASKIWSPDVARKNTPRPSGRYVP